MRPYKPLVRATIDGQACHLPRTYPERPCCCCCPRLPATCPPPPPPPLLFVLLLLALLLLAASAYGWQTPLEWSLTTASEPFVFDEMSIAMHKAEPVELVAA